jgi:hypothetical protein
MYAIQGANPSTTPDAILFTDSSTNTALTFNIPALAGPLSSNSDLLIGVYNNGSFASGSPTCSENGSLTIDQNLPYGSTYGLMTGHLALATNSSSTQLATESVACRWTTVTIAIAPAAPIPVQVGHHVFTGTLGGDVITFGGNVAVGHLVVGIFALNGSVNNPSPTISTIVGLGALWNLRAARSNGSGVAGARIEIWSAVCVTAGATINPLFNGQTGTSHITVGSIVAEYATYGEGIDALPSAVNSGTSAAPISGNAITTHANDLLVFGVASDIQTTPTVPTNSFISEFATGGVGAGAGNDLGGPLGYALSDLTVTATSTYATGMTAGSGNWATALVVFKQGATPIAAVTIPASTLLPASRLTDRVSTPINVQALTPAAALPRLVALARIPISTRFSKWVFALPWQPIRLGHPTTTLTTVVTQHFILAATVNFAAKFSRWAFAVPWQPLRLGRAVTARALLLSKSTLPINAQALTIRPKIILGVLVPALTTVLNSISGLRYVPTATLALIAKALNATGAIKKVANQTVAILADTLGAASRFLSRPTFSLLTQVLGTGAQLITRLTFPLLQSKANIVARLISKTTSTIINRTLGTTGAVKSIPTAAIAIIAQALTPASRLATKVSLSAAITAAKTSARFIGRSALTALSPRVVTAPRLARTIFAAILTPILGAGTLLKTPRYGANVVLGILTQALTPTSLIRTATSASLVLLGRVLNAAGLIRTSTVTTLSITTKALAPSARLMAKATSTILTDALGAAASIATTIRNISGSFLILTQSFTPAAVMKMPVAVAVTIINRAVTALTIFKLRPNVTYSIINRALGAVMSVRISRVLPFSISQPALAAGYVFSRIIDVLTANTSILSSALGISPTIKTATTAIFTLTARALTASARLTTRVGLSALTTALSRLATIKTVATTTITILASPRVLAAGGTRFQQTVSTLVAQLPSFTNLAKVRPLPLTAFAIITQALTTTTRIITRISTLLSATATSFSNISLVKKATSVIVAIRTPLTIFITLSSQLAGAAVAFALHLPRFTTTAITRTRVLGTLAVGVSAVTSSLRLAANRIFAIVGTAFSTLTTIKGSFAAAFNIRNLAWGGGFILGGGVRQIAAAFYARLSLLAQQFPFAHASPPVVIVFDAELDAVIAFDATL